MKLVYRIQMDETTRYDFGWDEVSFKQQIVSILKNPHGYDEAEDFKVTLDGSATKVKLKKEGKEYEVNIITRMEYSDDEIIYTAEIWPLELPELLKKVT